MTRVAQAFATIVSTDRPTSLVLPSLIANSGAFLMIVPSPLLGHRDFASTYVGFVIATVGIGPALRLFICRALSRRRFGHSPATKAI